jgi:26S proteasome regulatory subunit N5
MNVVDSTGPAKASVSYAEQVAQARAQAASGNLDGAIQNLLSYEKTARLVRRVPFAGALCHALHGVVVPVVVFWCGAGDRCRAAQGARADTCRRMRARAQAADPAGTKELVLAMVEFCWTAKNLPTLNETLVLLSKRRAQLKQATTAIVQQASEYVDQLELEADKLTLIESLRAISEGKMYVEVERARLTKKLASMHEAKGEKEKARKLMQDTTVETLGGMERREKTEFILEQIRLNLETEDFVRAHITAKKIQVKVFKDAELEDLKMRYYTMIVRYHQHSQNWMEIFRAYQAMFNSPSMAIDEAAAHRCVKLQTLYLLLSPFDNEQSESMHALSAEKTLTKLPLQKQLLKLFITKEIFHFADLRAGLAAELAAADFSAAEQETMLDVMQKRVTQHNIHAIAGYYSRITMERLAHLIALPMATMEEQLCEMVTKKQLYARIDRPAGIIGFAPPKSPNELLNDWSSDISSLLNLVESTCHLIHKENMVHKVA